MNALEKYAAKKKLAARLGAGIGATLGTPFGTGTSMIGAAIGARHGHRFRSALGAGAGHLAAVAGAHGALRSTGKIDSALLALPGLGAAIAHGGTKAVKAVDRAQDALKPIASGKNIKGVKRLSVKKNRVTKQKAQDLIDTLEKIKATL